MNSFIREFRRRPRLAVLLTLLCLGAPFAWAQSVPDGNTLLARIDEIRFPEDFTMKVTLTTVTQGEDPKVMSMEVTHKKGLGSFLQILSPPRSRGTRMLTESGSLWLYNPHSGSSRPLRLAPRDSFQGSAFSNSDVSRTSFLDDYRGVFEKAEVIDHPEFGKVKVWQLRAVAKRPEAAYGWIEMWVRQGDLLPLKFDYYAKSGLLYRKMVLSHYKEMAGRLRATEMQMVSLDQTGTTSTLVINSMKTRHDIPDELFNLNALTR